MTDDGGWKQVWAEMTDSELEDRLFTFVMSSMARKQATKPLQINRATPAASSLLEHYCRGLEDWPRSWMGWEKDVPPDEQLVACFRPFLGHLIASDRSPRTIQRHVDNLWALGGEIIRDLHEEPSLRKERHQNDSR